MELSTTTITKGRRYIYDVAERRPAVRWTGGSGGNSRRQSKRCKPAKGLVRRVVAERLLEASDGGTTTLADGHSRLERIYVVGSILFSAIDYNRDGDIGDNLNTFNEECLWLGGLETIGCSDAAFYYYTDASGRIAALGHKNNDRKILEYYRYRAFGEMITLPVVDDGLAEGSTAADGLEDSPLSLTDNNTFMLSLRTTHGEFAGRVSWWGNEFRRSYARFSGPTGIEFQDGGGDGETANDTTGEGGDTQEPPVEDQDCCGPIIDDWLQKELSNLVAFFKKKVAPNVNSNLMRLALIYKWGQVLLYRDLNPKTQNCPKGDSCKKTVTLCGKCIHISEVGNMAYGAMVKSIGARMHGAVVTAIGAEAIKEGWGADKPEDLLGVMNGVSLVKDGQLGNVDTMCNYLKASYKKSYIDGVSDELGKERWRGIKTKFDKYASEAATKGSLDIMGESYKGCKPCEEKTSMKNTVWPERLMKGVENSYSNRVKREIPKLDD